MSDKKELRVKFRSLRKELKSFEKDEKIAENVFSAFGEYESYFIYLSFGSEAGTEGLIKALQAKDKEVCVPRVDGREMRSVPLTDKLEVGAYGILAPTGGEEKTCQIALTPLLAVDKQGYRLGYGGGYYDRYFAMHPEIMKVGIAYEGQVVENLPHEETDIPLDAIVTEEAVRYILKRRTGGKAC